MTSKQIIKKFSDNHCLVLENNQISLRENEFTAYRIVLGKSTNELLEFVKDTYLQLQAKEQECDELRNFHINLVGVKECDIRELLKLKQTLTEIKEIAERNHKTKEELFKIRHSRLTKFSMGALDGRHDLASEILQKISECEGNNEN